MGVATVSIPEQGDAAHDERVDRRGQVVAAGQPAGGHGAAVADRAQRLGQRRATDTVDDAGPELGTERPPVVLGELASHHLGRTQSS